MLGLQTWACTSAQMLFVTWFFCLLHSIALSFLALVSMTNKRCFANNLNRKDSCPLQWEDGQSSLPMNFKGIQSGAAPALNHRTKTNIHLLPINPDTLSPINQVCHYRRLMLLLTETMVGRSDGWTKLCVRIYMCVCLYVYLHSCVCLYIYILIYVYVYIFSYI